MVFAPLIRMKVPSSHPDRILLERGFGEGETDFRETPNRLTPFHCGVGGGRGKIGLEGVLDLLSGKCVLLGIRLLRGQLAVKIEEMSGLEILRAVTRGELPHPSICETVPMKILEVEKGTVRFRAEADGRHINPMGGVHGGFAATVLDSVTGCAVHTMLNPGASYGTVELNVRMLRPVPRQVELEAVGTVLSVEGDLVVSEGEIRDGMGTLLAHGTATCTFLEGK